VRSPRNIIEEMSLLRAAGVEAFRFVDDLFLGARRVIEKMMDVFTAENVGEWARWDATGRINVLHRASDATLEQLAANGLREVALGIESGSARVLGSPASTLPDGRCHSPSKAPPRRWVSNSRRSRASRM
jgi:radical SAM superfamily enzyme YgiQ (UPF0313 family)